MKTIDSLYAHYSSFGPRSLNLRLCIADSWMSGVESLKGREPAELVGCGDHSCVVTRSKGMGTNGGCRCDERRLRRAVGQLRYELNRLQASIGPANPDQCSITGYCHSHGFYHGQEAEELRAGVEEALRGYGAANEGDDPYDLAHDHNELVRTLTELLDATDARDSLAFGEMKAESALWSDQYEEEAAEPGDS